jgi:hypothetical protein
MVALWASGGLARVPGALIHQKIKKKECREPGRLVLGLQILE